MVAKKKTIAVVTPAYPPGGGGMGNVAAMQAELLATAGADVTVFSIERKGATGRVKYEQLRRVARFGFGAFVPQIRSIVRTFDAVLLHYPFYGAAEPFALFGGSKQQKLFVYYHMDVKGRWWMRPVLPPYRLLVLPQLLRRADAILMSSLDYLQTSHAAPYLKRKTSVSELPPSVDIERFTPAEDKTVVRHQLGLAPEVPIALFVGQLDKAHYFKGVENLLHAWPGVLQALPNAQLVIVGEGDNALVYKRIPKKLGTESSVRFAGRVSDEQLVQYYQAATVSVLPSVDRSEAFGLVLAEAGACGTPSIASDLPGVRMVIKNGETGWLTEPNNNAALRDTLIKALDDQEEAVRRGLVARHRVISKFSNDVVGQRLKALFSL